MSFCEAFRLDRSSLTRLLLTAVLPVALMIISTYARAQVGANGMNGSDCSTSGCFAGSGTDGESVTGGSSAVGGDGGNGGSAFGDTGGCNCGYGGNGGGGGSASASGTAFGGAGGNAGDFQLVGDAGSPGNGGDAIATGSGATTAVGGAGGQGISQGGISYGGAGGNATATSITSASGSGNAISSATATGGDGGGGFSQGGNATATSSATANGSGDATASATATPGFAYFPGAAYAASNAETAEGGLALAQAQAQGDFFDEGQSQSTAKTTFGGVSVQSTAELIGSGSTEALAQAGSGQSVNSGQFDGFAFSTVLPNAAYATTLIGSASNVADALLGPADKIFGTAILGGYTGNPGIDDSSTFDFSFQGDLVLGVVRDDGFSIIVNGVGIPFEDAGDNSLINLGFISGPIDLTIEGDGVFAVGGAVPEPSTWAMMLVGFAGLSFAGYARSRNLRRV